MDALVTALSPIERVPWTEGALVRGCLGRWGNDLPAPHLMGGSWVWEWGGLCGDMYRNPYRIFRFYQKSFTLHPKTHTQDPPMPTCRNGIVLGDKDARTGAAHSTVRFGLGCEITMWVRTRDLRQDVRFRSGC